MRPSYVLVLAAVATLTACSQKSQNLTPKTDDDKALYTAGALLAQNLLSFELTEKELEMVKAGLADGARSQSKLTPEEMDALIPKLQELQMARVEAASLREKDSGAEFLAKAAAEAGATQTASGMVYKMVSEGSGEAPQASDVVKVHYTGRFVDGKEFDSSTDGDPAVFPLGAVIGCWTEGVQLMRVGGKAQLTCPPDLAYGEQGRPPQMPGNATLVFDVELLEIVKDEE